MQMDEETGRHGDGARLFSSGSNEPKPVSLSVSPRPRVSASILKWLVQLSRFGLAALFLFAVGAKIYFINNPDHSFLKMMPNLVGQRWALPVVVAVFLAESAAVILLSWSRTARIGALWTAVLLISFAAYALYYRYGLGNSEGLECGCFGGIIGSQLGVTTALRNLALLIPALIVFFGAPRIKGVSEARP